MERQLPLRFTPARGAASLPARAGRPIVGDRTADDLAFEIVVTDAALAAAGPDWTALWRRSGALVFQSHAWVSAWWASSPDRDRRCLRIVLARRGGALVGVLPLAIRRQSGLRVLEWAAKESTDFADALLDKGEDVALLGSLWRHACRSGRFDLAYLNRLRPDAAARTLLTHAPGVRLRPSDRREANWRVQGAGFTGAAWFDAQSKKTRQNYRRGFKAIAERGAPVFRLLRPDEPLQPLLDRFSAFKRAWLAANNLMGTTHFYDAESTALPAMVGVLAATGLLHVFVLECAGAVVAVSVNFVQDGVMMAFVTSYDPAFERGSPGMVLMIEYIMWSLDRGLQTIDFLGGDEGFKSRFGTERLSLDAMIGARTFLGATALLAERARAAIHRRGALTA